MDVESFKSTREALVALTRELILLIQENGSSPFHLALSGGDTARRLFRLWAQDYSKKIDWPLMRFYWVDERCVPPENEESNFKHANELLFKPLQIPASHIFRIKGEVNPEQEAERYTEMVKNRVTLFSDIPSFDCIILGVGNDGHTASIFQNSMELLTDERCYAVSTHPVTGQKRITMTGPIILNGATLFVPIVGKGKAQVMADLMHAPKPCDTTPACYILSRAQNLTVFTDCL